MVLQLICTCKCLRRSSFIWRERFNLSAEHRDMLEADAPEAPAAPSGTFAVAWRNYIKAVFAKGFMYQVSCNPSAFLYIAENKTLAGQEHRSHVGEAIGRQMAVVFFETKEPAGNLVQRTRRETQGMHHQLMTIAELLLALGVVLPADAGRTAAETEILLEAKYAELDILRFTCVVEPEAPDVHVYHLEDQVDAEMSLVSAVPADQRTKMMMARALHRNDELLADETLRACWNNNGALLRDSSTGSGVEAMKWLETGLC